MRDLSFDVPSGGITGLIGPNGSGKTTVLHLVTGELPPDAGSIHFQGEEIIGARSFEICRLRVARTFQLVRILPGMTTRENIMLGRMFGSDPRAACDGDAARPMRCSNGSASPTARISSARSSPISTRSASSSPARWRRARSCSSSTNGWPASIRRN